MVTSQANAPGSGGTSFIKKHTYTDLWHRSLALSSAASEAILPTCQALRHPRTDDIAWAIKSGSNVPVRFQLNCSRVEAGTVRVYCNPVIR